MKIIMTDSRHCCGVSGKRRQTQERKRSLDMYRCGVCYSVFDTICTLHAHCSQHAEGGSYVFDHVTLTAYPKYVSVSAFTQVTDELIDTELRDSTIIADTAHKRIKFKNEPSKVVSKRKTLVRQSKSQAKLNRIWVSPTRKQKMILKEQQSGRHENGVDNHPGTRLDTECEESHNKLEAGKMGEIKPIKDKEKEVPKTIYESSEENIPKSNSVRSKQTSRKRTRHGRSKSCHSNNTTKTGKDIDNSGDASHEKDELTASEVLIAMSKGVTAEDGETTNDQTYRVKISPEENIEHATDSVINEKNESGTADGDESKFSKSEQDGNINSDNVKLNRKPRVPKIRKNSVRKAAESKGVQTCPVCGKVGGQAVMNYHKYMHMERKNFTCETCGTSFKHPRCLQMHQKQHGEKKFECTICSAAFYRKQYLRTHMLKHTGEEPFMCEACGKSYREKNNLTRHIRHVHEKVRNYECDICKEKFFRSDHLKNHRLRHAEADKKCMYCPRLFKHPDDLERHTKTHTGEKKWHCNICGHGFVSVSPYYVHMLKKHGVNRDEAKALKGQLQAEHKLRIKELESTDKAMLFTKDVGCQSTINTIKPAPKQPSPDITTLPVILPVSSGTDLTDIVETAASLIHHHKLNPNIIENEHLTVSELDTSGMIEPTAPPQHVTQYLLGLGGHDLEGGHTVVVGDGTSLGHLEIEIDDVAVEGVQLENIEAVMYVDSDQFAEEVIIHNQ